MYPLQPSMNFRNALREAVRTAFCTGLSGSDDFWSRLGFDGNPLLAGFRGRGSLGYRLFCNREPPPFPAPSAPGGQCPVFYEVSGRRTLIGQPGSANEGLTVTFQGSAAALILGPITPIPGTVPPGAVIGGTGGVPISILDGNGVDRSFFATQQVGTPINTNNPNWIVQAPVYSFVRADGLPDDCGDFPSPTPTPPSPNPVFPVPVPYEDDDGNPVNVPVNIVFAFPFAFINGTLNVPFRITIPVEFTIPIDGTINLETGDINFNFGGGGGGGGGGCLPPPPQDFDAPDVPPPPPDIPLPSPLPPNPEDTRLKDIIRGVVVTVSDNGGKVTIVNQDSNPDLYIPRVGNVQFAIQIGNSVSWTERVSVTSLRQFIACPWEGGAIDVRGTAEPGFIMTLTPVIGRIPENQNYDF